MRPHAREAGSLVPSVEPAKGREYTAAILICSAHDRLIDIVRLDKSIARLRSS